MKDGMEVRMVEPQSPTEDDDDEDDDDENMKAEEGMLVQTPSKAEQFMDQYNGCPVLKFQVVNEMCNREGSEIVDAIMKVIGIKFKGRDGQVTHSQYVRVNLVDFEHPFFSRVWHGVHILNANSPLLTEKAKQRINKNKGSWPPEWFNPETIKKKLEFNDLVVTVAGISNVSAVTVHAYKRYKIGDDHTKDAIACYHKHGDNWSPTATFSSIGDELINSVKNKSQNILEDLVCVN
eukprot:CCRYP_012260-RC/>CCRYP_012260-RC protein AED:0.29 eAED:0.29 QI:1282/0.8/0.66/1/0.8/0.5/6/0/234